MLPRLVIEREHVVLTLATKVVRTVRIEGASLQPQADENTRIPVPISLPLRGGARSIEAGLKEQQPDPSLVAALRRAHAMLAKAPDGGPELTAAPTSWYERRVLRLAFLAPELQRAILAGAQPRHVNLEFLVRSEIPLAWADQAAALRWTFEPVMYGDQIAWYCQLKPLLRLGLANAANAPALRAAPDR